MTNYEKIKNMDIDEMVELLDINEGECGGCQAWNYCYDNEDNEALEEFECEDRIKLWLLSEAK